jgi:hypothetical protein
LLLVVVSMERGVVVQFVNPLAGTPGAGPGLTLSNGARGSVPALSMLGCLIFILGIAVLLSLRT